MRGRVVENLNVRRKSEAYEARIRRRQCATCLLVFFLEDQNLVLGIVIHFFGSPCYTCLACYSYGPLELEVPLALMLVARVFVLKDW